MAIPSCVSVAVASPIVCTWCTWPEKGAASPSLRPSPITPLLLHAIVPIHPPSYHPTKLSTSPKSTSRHHPSKWEVATGERAESGAKAGQERGGEKVGEAAAVAVKGGRWRWGEVGGRGQRVCSGGENAAITLLAPLMIPDQAPSNAHASFCPSDAPCIIRAPNSCSRIDVTAKQLV